MEGDEKDEEVDLEKLESVLSLLQSSGIVDGSIKSSLDGIGLSLNEEFIVKVLETPYISGENLISFFKWILKKPIFHKGLKFGKLQGKTHNISLAKRVVPNFMQRMSGIAILTKDFEGDTWCPSLRRNLNNWSLKNFQAAFAFYTILPSILKRRTCSDGVATSMAYTQPKPVNS